jgi:hypothetical protein
MIAGRAPSMPNWVAMLCGWWLGVALWGYFVAFHEMARALVGGFGSPGTSVAYAIAGSIVGALPLLALLPVADPSRFTSVVCAAAVLVGRQILRVRKDEQAFARLGSAGPGGAPPNDSVGLY